MSKSRPETPSQGGHPGAFALEQAAFEPEAADASTRSHLEGCDACRAAVAGLVAERGSFLAERPAHRFVAGVAARAEEEARQARPAWLDRLLDLFRSPRWLLVPAAAVAAVLLVVAIPTREPVEDGVRYKGGGALRLFHARGGGEARPLEPGVSLRPGDLLRFGVLSARGRFAFVASVDDAGRFTRYHPAGDGAAAPLGQQGALQLLPGSIVLDETTGREWIVLLLAERRLDEPAVREALLSAWRARAGDRLGPIGLDAEVDVVPITKAAP
ncbi:MAG: hypothetical protein IPO09_09560 [Anaeromyxobacter sp.]|nr:hypothetical protein [Anaeromyxobacter sp.]